MNSSHRWPRRRRFRSRLEAGPFPQLLTKDPDDAHAVERLENGLLERCVAVLDLAADPLAPGDQPAHGDSGQDYAAHHQKGHRPGDQQQQDRQYSRRAQIHQQQAQVQHGLSRPIGLPFERIDLGALRCLRHILIADAENLIEEPEPEVVSDSAAGPGQDSQIAEVDDRLDHDQADDGRAEDDQTDVFGEEGSVFVEQTHQQAGPRLSSRHERIEQRDEQTDADAFRQ